VKKLLMVTITYLCYDEGSPVVFSTLPMLRAAGMAETKKGKPYSVGSTKAWLEEQDAYTLHRPMRKRFARNPYTVTNVMDMWEFDLLVVESYAKYNNNFKYILFDVFSKFLYLITCEDKGRTCSSIFDDMPKLPSRPPVWLRTDKGKEFLNKEFQAIFHEEGIHFQVCRNPDVKCVVVERSHRTIHDILYKYFTYKNTFRYIDVMLKFVRA